MGPILIREMEGVVFRASSPVSQQSGEADERGEDTPLAGIILSSSGFSKQALLQVRSSNVPLVALHVLAQPHTSSANTEDEDATALVERCVSIVWNDRFGSPTDGLLEGGMEVRWVRSLTPHITGREESVGRPIIYRAGKLLRR